MAGKRFHSYAGDRLICAPVILCRMATQALINITGHETRGGRGAVGKELELHRRGHETKRIIATAFLVLDAEAICAG